MPSAERQKRLIEYALFEFVQTHMPWPFLDVSRHDSEGVEAAKDIARRLLPAVQREFDGIVESARATKRRTYSKSGGR